jgi:hypothetical protein
VTILSLGGSMSKDVRNEVSVKSSFVDVTERKMSSRRCWSFRGVPLRSSICWSAFYQPRVRGTDPTFWKLLNERSPIKRQ